MSIGIDKDVETIPFQVTLMDREVLRVTADGQFVWHPDADRMIEEGDFSHSPVMPFILRALRKRKWVGLEASEYVAFYNQFANYQEENPDDSGWWAFANAIEQALKEKNT